MGPLGPRSKQACEVLILSSAPSSDAHLHFCDVPARTAPGLVPLAVDALFATDATTSYRVTAVELYNDRISDLLAPLKKHPLPCDLDAARKAAAEAAPSLESAAQNRATAHHVETANATHRARAVYGPRSSQRDEERRALAPESLRTRALQSPRHSVACGRA